MNSYQKLKAEIEKLNLEIISLKQEIYTICNEPLNFEGFLIKKKYQFLAEIEKKIWQGDLINDKTKTNA